MPKLNYVDFFIRSRHGLLLGSSSFLGLLGLPGLLGLLGLLGLPVETFPDDPIHTKVVMGVMDTCSTPACRHCPYPLPLGLVVPSCWNTLINISGRPINLKPIDRLRAIIRHTDKHPGLIMTLLCSLLHSAKPRSNGSAMRVVTSFCYQVSLFPDPIITFFS